MVLVRIIKTVCLINRLFFQFTQNNSSRTRIKQKKCLKIVLINIFSVLFSSYLNYFMLIEKKRRLIKHTIFMIRTTTIKKSQILVAKSVIKVMHAYRRQMILLTESKNYQLV